MLAVFLAMTFSLISGWLAVYTGYPGYMVGYADFSVSLAVYAGWLYGLTGYACLMAQYAGRL
jgi:hypothetical protein